MLPNFTTGLKNNIFVQRILYTACPCNQLRISVCIVLGGHTELFSLSNLNRAYIRFTPLLYVFRCAPFKGAQCHVVCKCT